VAISLHTGGQRFSASRRHAAVLFDEEVHEAVVIRFTLYASQSDGTPRRVIDNYAVRDERRGDTAPVGCNEQHLRRQTKAGLAADVPRRRLSSLERRGR